MEFTRLGVVYIHLIACCVAIGLVISSDLKMVRELLAGNFERQDPVHLDAMQSTITKSLVVLWLTGATLIWIDVSAKDFSYFQNPKIQAKIAMVILLTLNGFLLHAAVMPAIKKAGSLLRLNPGRRVLALFAGAVSAVSWFYAAMLGVGRPLAWKYSLVELLAAYPFLVLGGFVLMTGLTAWAKWRDNAKVGEFA